MQTKEEYQCHVNKKMELKQLVKKDPYRLQFHLMPPTGWLNDPNGLCSFHGVQHIYFQYSPFTPTWGMKLWGHYTTVDWLHYQEEEPFLFADHEYDRDGVYSGSAFVKDDEIHYFYTGNVKHIDTTYDYIHDGREQNTIEVVSKDGFTYEEKHLIFDNQMYPSDMTCHVRDPKIFEKDQHYYMVLGARSKDNTGCVLLYQSKDLKRWKYHMRIQSDVPFGYMWECPDLIELEGKLYLICCPQGVEQDGINYQNIYQFGYFEVEINFVTCAYTISSFHELDKGFDIYAPQSYIDDKGRRILLAWMGIPDADYHNDETVAAGWQHAMTIPRELYINHHKLCQKPIKELEDLRIHAYTTNAQQQFQYQVSRLYECIMNFQTCTSFTIELRTGVVLQYQHEILSLKLGACGNGRDIRQVHITQLTKLQIYMDTSSVEIFINDGEEVLTSRYYTQDLRLLCMQGDFQMEVSIYALTGFEIKELEE